MERASDCKAKKERVGLSACITHRKPERRDETGLFFFFFLNNRINHERKIPFPPRMFFFIFYS